MGGCSRINEIILNTYSSP